MSAILSADDLNDFISPGVACVKPVETLPKQIPATSSNPYEVTREDKVPATAADAPPAQISLTDCLACSGCVTSAEAVLISLQSHQEVASTLDRYHNLDPKSLVQDEAVALDSVGEESKLFVASISPQTRASIAVTYGVSEQEAGYMIDQLLSGPLGLKSTGQKGSSFTWIVDTNAVRDLCLAGVVQEATGVEGPATPKRPILSSACPGWICYAEKTHPHVLPHLSKLKSPQAMSGTLLKSVLSRRYGIDPDRIWHLAIMPCFDKKLEASREELTDVYWQADAAEKRGVRDVDCVVTARELIMLADTRGISFPNLPRTSLPHTAFPDPVVDRFLFPRGRRRGRIQTQIEGSSGGWAYQIIRSQQRRLPGSEITLQKGRNADVLEYLLTHNGALVNKTGRYYGFQNIQNLVRKLKPAKKSRMLGATRKTRPDANGAKEVSALSEYSYIEVMACPGGCTNGGGQIKVSDVASLTGEVTNGGVVKRSGPAEQKEWLRRVDEAYFSGDESEQEQTTGDGRESMDINDADDDKRLDEQDEDTRVDDLLRYWTSSIGVPLDKLLYTTYRQVESDVGKAQETSHIDRVAGLAHSVGGAW